MVSLLDYAGDSTRLLLLGEGDFSFALQLASQLSSRACAADTRSYVIVATSFDDAATVRALYAHAAANIGRLLALGVEVLHGVDATDVAASLQQARRSGKSSLTCTTFDRVIFNFPQHAERRKVQKQRELLNRMFCSGAAVLVDRGQYLVTLKRGQGGTPLDNDEHAFDMTESRSTGKPYTIRKPADSWCLQHQAAEAGFILVAVRVAPIDSLQYMPTGRRGADRPFHCDSAVLHILELETEPFERLAVFPLRHAFVIQLFCWGQTSEAVEADCASDASLAEAFFAAQCDARICDVGVVVSFTPGTEWLEHERPRYQRKYEICISSCSRALSRSHATRLASQIRRSCFERFVSLAPCGVEVNLPNPLASEDPEP
jgi:hypothetical protein